MAQAVPVAVVSFQEFLDFEETTPDKHELFRGRIYAMAGGTANHDDIQLSLPQPCGRALQGRQPCRFVGENRTSKSRRADPDIGPMERSRAPQTPSTLVRARITIRLSCSKSS